MMDAGAERYLIVSLGSIGRRHLGNLRQLRPKADVGVLHLTTMAHRRPMHDEGVHRFESLRQALEFAPCAAIVAGPASTHVPVARAIIEAGVHVLVEKPLSTSVEGCAKLIETARRLGRVLMTGYNLPFLPSLRLIKECLQRGDIGEVISVRAEVGQYLPDWRPHADYQTGVSAQRALGGGALLELSHELHYLYWLFGMPERVTARAGKYGDLLIDVEDLVELLLEFESPRRLVSVHLDFLQRAPHRACRFVGLAGTIVWDAVRDTVDEFKAASGTWAAVPASHSPDGNQMYVDELQHFLDCIRDGSQPIVDGADGLNVLRIIEAARQSIAVNSTVEICHGE
jgi:predicted dehydrogenase